MHYLALCLTFSLSLLSIQLLLLLMLSGTRQDEVTHEMGKKQRQLEEGPRISSILQHCQKADKSKKKRSLESYLEGEDAETAAWRSGWGICKQDSVVGSSELSE